MLEEYTKVKYWIGNKSADQLFGTLKILPFDKKINSGKIIAQIPKLAVTSPAEQRIKVESIYLCAYSVPIDLEVKDLCEFVKACESYIEEMRVATTMQSGYYVILMLAKSKEAATILVNTLHGLKFSELFEGRCDLATIAAATVCTKKADAPSSSLEEAKELMTRPDYLFSNASSLSLSCPICLEKFLGNANSPATKSETSSSADSGYKLSILCGHYYHSVCLANCKNELCPLCRSPQSPGECNKCEICGVTDNLWLCLICGFMGCWNALAPCLSHSRNHYEDSMHTYALNIMTKKVWDYSKEGYVHRLIQNKVDGKMVEFEDFDLVRQQQVMEGDILKVSMKKHYNQKLDALNYEYNMLLMSQLETQKKYFEARLKDCHVEASKIKDQTMDMILKASDELAKVVEEVKAEEDKNANLKSTNVELRKKYTNMIKEEIKKAAKVEEKSKEMETKIGELDAKIGSLKAELSDIKFHLSTQSKVKKVSQGAGGQALIFASGKSKRANPKKSKK